MVVLVGRTLSEARGKIVGSRRVLATKTKRNTDLAFGFRKIACLFQLFKIGFRFRLRG